MSAGDAGSTEALLSLLGARFASRKANRRSDDLPPDEWLAAAAVLDVFDCARLNPVDGRAGTTALDALLPASVPAVGWRHAGLRTLRPTVRAAGIRGLGNTEAMADALAANPDRTCTPLQALFERWLRGERFAPEQMAYSELECLNQLYEWGLAQVGPGLPPAHRVERARARRSSTAYFEHLVDDEFVGRDRELAALRKFVRESGSWGPLTVWGPGGAGKTALIGRFLIENLGSRGGGWLPFAYLPFDSETLDIREPFTVLIAIAMQLASQVNPPGRPVGPDGGWAEAAERFRLEVQQYRDRRASLQRRGSEHSARGARLRSLHDAEYLLYGVFANLLEAAMRCEHAPVVLVFDTFEEVVYRAEEDLLGFWEMLRFLQARLPQLRIVLAGRTRIPMPGLKPLPAPEVELGDLATPDAVALLTRLGIHDPQVAARVVARIGANPLSLRLAARVAAGTHAGHEIEDVVAGQLDIQQIGAELVRGQLYRRLLAHIHDDDVRTLAHPGIVLRRITPTIITRVLGPACGLAVDEDRSLQLMDELAREQALVSVERDGSLRFREEVRHPVLELLLHDKPAQVRRIHEFAVAYYTERVTPAERAEELYHRMMLRQSPAVLDRRWAPDVDRFLGSAIDELPPGQRRWLAGRMSIELPREVYQLAATAEWETLIGRKAMSGIRFRDPAWALQMLAERRERTPESPLVALEARALLDLARPDEAAACLDAAIARFPLVGNPGRLAEMLWLRAQAALATDRPADALEFLDRLLGITERLASSLARVQALTETIDVLERTRAADEPRLAEVRRSLAASLRKLSTNEMSSEASLVRLALVRLGPHYPGHLADLAPLVGFGLSYLAKRGLVNLAPALDSLLDTLPASLKQAAGDSAGAVLGEAVEELRNRWQDADPDVKQRITPIANVVLTLLQAEGATLSGASLAGIDEYREPWELDFTEESRA